MCPHEEHLVLVCDAFLGAARLELHVNLCPVKESECVYVYLCICVWMGVCTWCVRECVRV